MKRVLPFSFQPSAIKRLLAFLAFSTITASSAAQQGIPFIQATSKKIKVLDGDYLQDGELVPGLNPDTYHFRPSAHPKKIAYYTDKDSIVFWAKAGDLFNFGIVLNGIDTCYQRVTSENPNKVHYLSSKRGLANDTLPFVLGPNNAIHLKGKINHSKELDLIFDTGASIGVLSEEGQDKGAALRSNNKNVFEIGNIVISNSPVSYINYYGRLKADGVLGYNAFEGKVVEINYDKNILVIHHKAFDTRGYVSSEMKWRGSAMFVEGRIGTRNKTCNGLFLFDTGSKWALSLNKAFVVQNGLYGTMEKTGTRRAKGADGKTIKSNTVILPALYLAGLLLPNVPTDMELPEESEGSLEFNILGNDVLKRFNAILDYKNGFVYLKPNSLQNVSYNKTLDEKDLLLIAIIIICIGLIIFLLYKKAKQQRQPKTAN
jgi:hypothetical protein